MTPRRAGIRSFIEAGQQGTMPTRAELLHDTRFQRVTAAILAGAVGRTAVDLYCDLEQLRGLRVCDPPDRACTMLHMCAARSPRPDDGRRSG